jgi:hypothetical protein
MANGEKTLLAFNRGVISKRGLARQDLERMAMSAEKQTNFIPRVLGSMMLRPGLKYIDTMQEDLQLVRQMPFVYGVDDTALFEFGSGAYMKIRVDDVVVARVAVGALVTDGGFDLVLPGVPGVNDWVDASDPGATATSGPASSPVGTLNLDGTGDDYAIVTQRVEVTGGEELIEHSLGIGITTEFIRIRVGTTLGDDDLIAETELGKGGHNLAFIPQNTHFFIELSNDSNYRAVCTGCQVTAAGELVFSTGWSVEDQVAAVRWTQSGDVVFTTNRNTNMKKIERRDYVDLGTSYPRSWSLVDYGPEDGPFQTLNVSATTIETDAIEGDVTLTASKPIFKQTMGASIFGAGILVRAESQGQVVTVGVNAANQFSPEIRVSGNGESRRFGIIIENIPPGSGTVTVQFSIGTDSGPWNDLSPQYTTNTNTSYLDEQDGQIIYYRIGVKAGDFTSGPINCTLSFTNGGRTGIARMTGWIDSTHIFAKVLEPFGSLLPTKDWCLGEWSLATGYPTSTDIHENRLWFAGNDRIYGSVSDNYESFDDETEGDSGPINRNIGSGPIRVISWLKSLGRLLMGTSENAADMDAAKIDGNHPLGVRSSSFDEALTPFNFNIKTIASKGVFVDRTLQRLYELSYSADNADYLSVDLSIFAPDFNVVGIRQIAVQMKPDVRVHCVRTDGTVGMLVYDRLENVICWCDVELGGPGNWCVEDVAVLPGQEEDQVYYTVKGFNSVDGEERYLLKWSKEDEAIGGLNNYLSDAWGQYDAAPTSLLTGLERLAGHTVSVWADGADRGVGVVTQFGSPGELDLTILEIDGVPTDNAPYSNVVYGLPYTAQFKSAKLGNIDGIGLLERKKVNQIGFIAENLHYQGLQYGPDFSELYDMPLVEQGQVTAADFIWEDYHEDNFPFGGEWIPDSRICLQAASPRPATILAAIAEFQSVEKRSNRKRTRR